MRKGFLRFAVPLVLVGMVSAACSNNDDNAGSSGSGVPVRAVRAAPVCECNADIKVGSGAGRRRTRRPVIQRRGQPGAPAGDRRRARVRGERQARSGQRGGLEPRQQHPGTRERRATTTWKVSVSRSHRACARSPVTSRTPTSRWSTVHAFIDGGAAPNVLDLSFSANESSYLVGIAAAMQAQKDGSDTVGFLGGQTGPLIGSFEAGYEAGVCERRQEHQGARRVHR